MDDALQRDVAARMVELFRAQGVEVVLVGSTAIVALELAPVTSKDADLLAPATLSSDKARKVLAVIAGQLGLETVEPGWNVLALVKRREDGAEAWRVDLLVPEAGPIPPEAARLVRKRAVRTDIGLAAVPEHIVAMKAIAWGDCLGDGSLDEARKYATDLLRLRDVVRAPNWAWVRELLRAFQAARARPASQILDETFKTDFEREFGVVE